MHFERWWFLVSNHIGNNDGPLPAGRKYLAENMKKHEKIIIKEKCYGRNDFIRNSAGIAGVQAV